MFYIKNPPSNFVCPTRLVTQHCLRGICDVVTKCSVLIHVHSYTFPIFFMLLSMAFSCHPAPAPLAMNMTKRKITTVFV